MLAAHLLPCAAALECHASAHRKSAQSEGSRRVGKDGSGDPGRQTLVAVRMSPQVFVPQHASTPHPAPCCLERTRARAAQTQPCRLPPGRMSRQLVEEEHTRQATTVLSPGWQSACAVRLAGSTAMYRVPYDAASWVPDAVDMLPQRVIGAHPRFNGSQRHLSRRFTSVQSRHRLSQPRAA